MAPNNKKYKDEREIKIYREISTGCISSQECERREAQDLIVKSAKSKQHNKELLVFICEGVRLNILQGNMENLLRLLRIVKTLVDNKIIPANYQLHGIIMSCLTCCYSEYDSRSFTDTDLQLQVREFSALQTINICQRYEEQCEHLTDFVKDKVYRTFLSWLKYPIDGKQTTARLTSLYGILFCMKRFGLKSLTQFIFPSMSTLCEHLNSMLKKTNFNQPDVLVTLKETQFNVIFDKLLSYLRRELAVPLMQHRRISMCSVSKADYIADYENMGEILYMDNKTFERRQERAKLIEEKLKELALNEYY